MVLEHVYDVNGYEIRTIHYANRIDTLANYDTASVAAALVKNSNKDQYQFRTFDSQGRLLSYYDPLGYATVQSYDGNGNVTVIRKYAIAVNLEKLKKGHQPLPSEAGIRTQYFTYDGLNRPRFSCDGNQYITEFVYGEDGKTQTVRKYANKINLPGTRDFIAEYIVSHLISDANDDQSSYYLYDKAGRLITEISPEGCVKSYAYDDLGNVIATIRYATRLVINDLASCNH